MTEHLQLPEGHKYALLTLPDRHGANEAGILTDLGDGYIASGLLPVVPPEHWKQWLGSLLYGETERSGFYLVVHSPSDHPAVLDAENLDLQKKVYHLYTGLCIAVPYFSHGEIVSLTGAIRAGEADVRQYTRYNRTFYTAGSPHAVINQARLRAAKRMSQSIQHFRATGEMPRFPRILGAFRNAMAAPEMDVRLHQFVRSIEGFLLPKPINADEFANRAQRIVKGDHREDLKNLYDIRGAIEHLHGPFNAIRGPEKDRHNTLLRRAIQAETLARYCLRYFLDTPEIWTHFSTSRQTQKLWNLPLTDFETIWSGKLALGAATRDFLSRLPDNLDDDN